MNAEDRGMEMMYTKQTELPPLAFEYAQYLCGRFGGCMEVFLTAFSHYAQAVEKLEAKDDMYKIDLEGVAWFLEKLSPQKTDV